MPFPPKLSGCVSISIWCWHRRGHVLGWSSRTHLASRTHTTGFVSMPPCPKSGSGFPLLWVRDPLPYQGALSCQGPVTQRLMRCDLAVKVTAQLARALHSEAYGLGKTHGASKTALRNPQEGCGQHGISIKSSSTGHLQQGTHHPVFP